MIKDCSFEELGNRLYWDLQEILSIFGAGDQAQMKIVLERVVTREFYELRMDGSVKNSYAIQLSTTRDNAILTKAEKSRGAKGPEGSAGKSIMGTLIYNINHRENDGPMMISFLSNVGDLGNDFKRLKDLLG